jgi:hypothetical protein
MTPPGVPGESIELQVADVLRRVAFPANKSEIVRVAREAGASNELLSIFEGLPEQDYANPDAVGRLVGSNDAPGLGS